MPSSSSPATWSRDRRAAIWIVVMAGLGGTLPTLSRLGAFYANNPQAPPPAFGVYLALAIFFAIGAILAAGFGEKDVNLLNGDRARLRALADAGARP